MREKKPFLTAVWQNLVMLNYKIEPAILETKVPAGTELDSWNGRTFISIVGFQFLKTRLMGLPIPFHINFEEVNLRFYVRYKAPDGEWRRGVVFIRELVPRWAIATVAKQVYNEPYLSLPMHHAIKQDEDKLHVSYGWYKAPRWQGFHVTAVGSPSPLVAGSEEEFITEHYWGYTRQKDGGTIEYQVEHPSWNVWRVTESEFDADVATLYGDQYVETLSQTPSSAFLADGSAISVHKGQRI